MEQPPLTDASAQTLRRIWFTYLDVLEPLRSDLHGYCLRLAGNTWDAEDLVQDTVLRGFAMTARGDFHGEGSRVRDARAYLFRTATNLWLDAYRRAARQTPGQPAPAAPADPDPLDTRDALTRAAGLASAQEFAALLLKEVYAFTLNDIADFIGTTPGTVKSALHRFRRKLREHAPPAPLDPAASTLVRSLAEAMNARDVDRILELMAETVKIDVCNVGGGRGRSGVWTQKTLAGTRFRYGEFDGAAIVLLFGEHDEVLSGVVRPEIADGLVLRLVDYHYAPHTLARVAEGLSLKYRTRGHHQRDQLPEMLATTGWPWH